MNRRAYINLIALLGRLANKYKLNEVLSEFSPEDQEIIRLAMTEYNFYHAHERVEAGTIPDTNEVEVAQRVGASKTGTLKLKRPV